MSNRTYPCGCEAGPEPVPDYCPEHRLGPIPQSALRGLGKELAELLDEDHWNNIESNYLQPAFEELIMLMVERDRYKAELEQAKLNALPPGHMGDWTDQLHRQVNDMAMLMRMLIWSLNKYSPDHSTTWKAKDYLKRHGLEGSPLRSESETD